MDAETTYLFSGGGTGGHLFPGLAVADELLRRDPTCRIVFVGSERPQEAQLVESAGFEHIALPSESLAAFRRRPLRSLWRSWQAYHEAKRLLRRLRPKVVVGLGGFASAAALLTAIRQRIPIVLLEQNTYPGRTIRWFSRFASHVCTSFAETSSFLRSRNNIVATGNPVRRDIVGLFNSTRTSYEGTNGKTLLVLGGSQGAEAVNEAVIKLFERYREQLVSWRVLHQAGLSQCDMVRKRYAELQVDVTVEPFFLDISDHYRSASIVISRAGATTLSELACAGLPAILIPYPHAADDHQRLNAEHFQRAGGASIVSQQDSSAATADVLWVQLQLTLAKPAVLAEMSVAMRQLARPQAAVDVSRLLRDVGQADRKSPGNTQDPAVHLRAG